MKARKDKLPKPTKVLSRHHRRPVSRGGTDCIANVSWVLDTQHDAWNRLFQNKSPIEIAQIINATWLDPDWYFVPKRRK